MCYTLFTSFKNLIIISVLACLLLTSLPLASQQNNTFLNFQITQKDDLSLRPVYDTLQDSLGYIWFTTEQELNRYDGYTFQKFTNRSDSNYKINHYAIKSIYKTINGGLLVSYKTVVDTIDFIRAGSTNAIPISLREQNGVEGEIVDVFIDKNGSINVLTQKGNEYQFYSSTSNFSFQKKIVLRKQNKEDQILEFLKTHNGNYWLNKSGHRMQLIDSKGGILQDTDLSAFYNARSLEEVNNKSRIFYEDQKNRTWLSFSGLPGLFKSEGINESFNLDKSFLKSKNYWDVWEDLMGNLIFSIGSDIWTVEELYFLEEKNNLLKKFDFKDDKLKINKIFSRDFSKMVFLGTFNGLKKIVFKDSNIENILWQELEDDKWGYSVRGITEAKNGDIYFTREQENWYRINAINNEIDTIPFVSPFSDSLSFLQNSFDLKYDPSGVIWGMQRDAFNNYFLLEYNIEADSFATFPCPRFIQSIFLDKSNKVWIAGGTKSQGGGLYFFNQSTRKVELFLNSKGLNPLEKKVPRCFYETKDNTLLIGTKTGLLAYNKTKEEIEKNVFGINTLLSNKNIIAIYENNQGEYLIGTEGGGLNVFNVVTQEMIIYDEDDGLCDNNVCGIVPDGQGNYWLSTYNGLSFFDSKTKSFRNFYKSDGFSYNEFNRYSYFKNSKGRYFFGGMNGLNSFYSEDVLNTKPTPQICLSKISLFNKKQDSLLVITEGLKGLTHIDLSPYDSYFQLEFFLPDYKLPQKNRYRYQLIGIDNDWTELNNTNTIRYHYLPPGTYQLNIQAAASGRGWTGKGITLSIEVDELIYKTTLAYFTYFLLGIGLIYLVYKMRVKRKLELAESNRLKELDEFKSRFYANITHEFRTPLTLISGPIENAISNFDEIKREDLFQDLKLVGRNSKRLLYLINRILDLSKLEAGKLKPDLILGNVIDFLRYISESFHSLAQTKDIKITFYSEVKNPVMDFDKEKIAHVLFNLLSNAIKFTPNGGGVILHSTETDNELIIKVKDNGVGISADQLPFIFDRYHIGRNQKNSGTGIGLAFTKELVNILNGEISVENNFEKGSTFIVRLPISRGAEATEEKLFESSTIESISKEGLVNSKDYAFDNINTENENDKPYILVIEDHPEVAHYIINCLKENYQINLAVNGKIGVEKALETIPDLILSDVMMPEKDGLEVCAELKEDEKTSHIPIILLTAKADIESKLEGLKKGADDYLGKPFNEKELKIRIENLLENRKKLQKFYNFKDTLAYTPSETIVDETVKVENAFLIRVRSIIEKHLNDSSFDVSKLCKAVGMSRTQLHRKLTALTNDSTTAFINLVRIENAKLLLDQPEMSIADVAYATGFSDPNYFSRVFTKIYGSNPTEFRKKSKV